MRNELRGGPLKLQTFIHLQRRVDAEGEMQRRVGSGAVGTRGGVVEFSGVYMLAAGEHGHEKRR